MAILKVSTAAGSCAQAGAAPLINPTAQATSAAATAVITAAAPAHSATQAGAAPPINATTQGSAFYQKEIKKMDWTPQSGPGQKWVDGSPNDLTLLNDPPPSSSAASESPSPEETVSDLWPVPSSYRRTTATFIILSRRYFK